MTAVPRGLRADVKSFLVLWGVWREHADECLCATCHVAFDFAYDRFGTIHACAACPAA